MMNDTPTGNNKRNNSNRNINSNINSSNDNTKSSRSCLAVVETSSSTGCTATNDGRHSYQLASSSSSSSLLFDGNRRVRLKLPLIPTSRSRHCDETHEKENDDDVDDDDDDAEDLLLFDLKQILIEKLDLPFLLLCEDDAMDIEKDGVDEKDQNKIEKEIRNGKGIKLRSTSMILELYNPRLESFHILKTIHSIPKCCRLRISIIIATDNNDDNNNNNNNHNTSPTHLLALPWREYTYNCTSNRMDDDGNSSSTIEIKTTNNSNSKDKITHFIQIHEVSNSGLGTGTNIWDGAIALTQFLEYHHNNDPNKNKEDTDNDNNTNSNDHDIDDCYRIQNKNILELGAGTGFVGIACSIAFHAKSVALTDLQYSMNNLCHNIQMNTPIPDTSTSTSTSTISANDSDSIQMNTPTPDTTVITTTNDHASINTSNDELTRRSPALSLSLPLPSSKISAYVLDWFDYKNTCDEMFFTNSKNDADADGNANANANAGDAESCGGGSVIPDIIVAADVVWVDSLVRPLVETMHYICSTAVSMTTITMTPTTTTNNNDNNTSTTTTNNGNASHQRTKTPPIILLSYQRRSLRVENNLFQTFKEFNFHVEDVTATTSCSPTNLTMNTHPIDGNATATEQQQQQQQRQQQKIRIYKITYLHHKNRKTTKHNQNIR